MNYVTEGILWYGSESVIITPDTTISELENQLGNLTALLSHEFDITHDTATAEYIINLAASNGDVGTSYDTLMLSELTVYETDSSQADAIETPGLRQRFDTLSTGCLLYTSPSPRDS